MKKSAIIGALVVGMASAGAGSAAALPSGSARGTGSLATAGIESSVSRLVPTAVASATELLPTTGSLDLSEVLGIKFTDIEQTAELVKPHPIPVFGVKALDEQNIRVRFLIGSTACYGYRVDVKETDKAVELSVVEGGLPGGLEACILIGGYGQTTVQLAKPLAGRIITVR